MEIFIFITIFLFAHPAFLQEDSGLVLGLQFSYSSFNDQSQNIDLVHLEIVTQDWYTGGPDAAFKSSELWLTQLQNVSKDTSNLGRIMYRDPIDLSTIAHFQTSFTFKIITTQPYGNCGSGMAFFVSSSIEAPNNSDTKGALGLIDPYSFDNPNFFAVEFDTRQSSSFDDPSSSHMGINVNSMASLSLADSSPGSQFYPELFLYNNYTFTVWIEYNCNSICQIQVWMTNHSGYINRPAKPCMNFTYNLSTVFKSPVYLGFSATSAPATQGAEAHIIYSWNFTSNVLATGQESCWNVNLTVPIMIVCFLFGLICGFLLFFAKRERRMANCSCSNVTATKNKPPYTPI